MANGISVYGGYSPVGSNWPRAAVLTGTATATGQYCVQVTDIGNLAAPVTYSITVAHP